MIMDRTRSLNSMQKREISVASFFFGDNAHLDFDAAGDYKILQLPPNSLILRCKIVSTAPFPIYQLRLGTTPGGTEITSTFNLAFRGTRRTALFIDDPDFSISGRSIYLSIPAALPKLAWIILVEYIEFKKTSGEYTRITNETE